MSSNLRLGLLLASVGALIFVCFFVAKRRLNIKYSIVWILWALLSLLMAIFPQTFYVYCMISKHNNEIIQLTYEIANLKKELEDLKKNNER